LSPLEVVAIFEATSGKKFEIQFVPEEALEAQKAAANDALAQSFAGLMLAFARGAEINMQHTIEAYGIRLSSVQDYARQCTGLVTLAD